MCSLSSFIDRRNGCTKYSYHAHARTVDGDKFCCYPLCHAITPAVHCSLRLTPTMINHLTSDTTILILKLLILVFSQFYIRYHTLTFDSCGLGTQGSVLILCLKFWEGTVSVGINRIVLKCHAITLSVNCRWMVLPTTSYCVRDQKMM